MKISFEKWQERQEQLRARRENQVYQSSITPIVFESHHPNSLRHLASDTNWSIYIDETGKHFGFTTSEESLASHQIGRIVALAVPSRTKLNPILDGFHAAEASSQDVDSKLEYLLRQDVGIFGFTVSDPEALAGNWFSHTVLLARWVLLQLPIPVGERSQVSFFIERNDARLAYQPIDSLATLLEGELQAIDSERYKNLTLNTQLMGKDHHMNAYVDVLAFTWGSPSQVSKDRLKKSGLAGHCFLRPDQQSMDRLYLSIARGKKLHVKDWYELCSAVNRESEHGLLAHYLHQLGTQTQNDLQEWHSYLDEVRNRMRSGDYRLNEVSSALDWLEKYTPKSERLPAIYRLPLETTRLGQENHLGKVNFERLQTCIELIQQLEEEDAQQACGALLRVLVSASNNFEFQILKPLLNEWIDKPIAVSGLANYARLHSSLGQIYAFTNNSEEAIKHFNKAIDLFDRLSDKQRANREKQQTNAYRLICLMDLEQVDENAFLRELTSNKNLIPHSRQLASSGNNLRYPHHLWLRALVSLPNAPSDIKDAYLEQSHQWQYGDDHPWGLIDAYRAWLLQIDEQNEMASQCMSRAVELCAQKKNGPILWWIAEVLRTLAQALGIDNIELPSDKQREFLKEVLPSAPHEQLLSFASEGKLSDKKQILIYLKLCLPFNFH